MKNYNIELLAPAGNIEAFMGAIHAGADAVYLGGAKFGARAYADNFTTEELVSCIRYAHLFGRKVYLTVNTLMKEEELDQLYDYLVPFYQAGLDAVIIQDLGVFQYIKNNFPGMELHASTQMTITGAHGASLLKELGASRIVPARELSLKEIVHMKEETGLEMETFIHGAMCYCYSGQCLFSSILGGRSGNRGRCAQPCRLPYSLDVAGKHRDECYPLSLKDMCTIEHIGDFMDAGIDSFKIEGRMKKPEYAAGVTAIYRKYIDRKKKFPDRELIFDKNDLRELTGLYIRSERQDGYYYKQNGADMVTLDSPAYSGSDDNLLARIRQKYIEPPLKKHISVYASFYCGSEVTVTCICDDISVTVTGDIMEPAKNKPMTSDAIEKQLRKLGDTCFEADVIEVSTDNLGFYPIKAINELRRKAVRMLEDQIIAEYHLPISRDLPSFISDNTGKTLQSISSKYNDAAFSKQKTGWTISITTFDQLSAVKEFLSVNTALPVSRIYVESELLLADPDLSFPPCAELFVALPYVMRRKDETVLRKLLTESIFRIGSGIISGILFRNLEEYAFLKKLEYQGTLAADAGIYIWNHESYQFWQDKADILTCPIELNKREWQAVFGNNPMEKIVYGRLPMMVTANCITKTGSKCLHGRESSFAYLTDRYNKKFPVIVQCNYCMNIILNSVPLSLHGREHLKWYGSVTKRISLTTESGREVFEILNFFCEADRHFTGEDVLKPPYPEYTTGHEKRGAE